MAEPLLEVKNLKVHFPTEDGLVTLWSWSGGDRERVLAGPAAQVHTLAVRPDGHMLAAYRYVYRNPVKAGLCPRPQDWLWSSYRGAIGLEPKFGFVNDQLIHGLFGGPPEKAIPAIRDFVEES